MEMFLLPCQVVRRSAWNKGIAAVSSLLMRCRGSGCGIHGVDVTKFLLGKWWPIFLFLVWGIWITLLVGLGPRLPNTLWWCMWTPKTYQNTKPQEVFWRLGGWDTGICSAKDLRIYPPTSWNLDTQNDAVFEAGKTFFKAHLFVGSLCVEISRVYMDLCFL